MKQEDDFENILLRAKRVLKFKNDAELASALGFTASAFSERKRRNVFPISELTDYIENDESILPITLEYILTGKKEGYNKELPLFIVEMNEQILKLPVSDQALMVQLVNSLYEKYIVNKTLDNKK